MKFEKPKLPYGMDALEPVISQETVEYHYGKHEQAYIDNLNKLTEGTKYAEMPLEQVICESEGGLFNNASQSWNHIFYFFQFNPGGQKLPTGRLLDKINETYGSFENFKKEVEEVGTTLFGSGWVWVTTDTNGNLAISKGSNAENPLTKGLKPILVIDVWEHAYYLDYQNRRAEYLHRIWDLIDWNLIDIRYINQA